MRDYADVVNNLRCCTVSVPCDNCTYQNDTEKCTFLEKEAADAIEELLAAVPHWISVEDELPDINDDVLVCNMDYGKTELGFATDAVWDGDNFLSAWNLVSIIHCVTHWMPLPAPPKEDAECEN